MVLKGAFAAVLCAGFLVVGGAAMADEYRPDEFLRLDLSRALLSPKRLGPDAEFAPVPIEAKSDSAPANTNASVWPKLATRKVQVTKTRIVTPRIVRPQIAKPQIAKPQIAKTNAEPPRAVARTKLVRRHGNPLDAQAMDTRIQTWPCKSGGICRWQR